MDENNLITTSDWSQMKESLKKDLVGMQESFVRIGYKLRKIRDQKLYEKDGWKSIADFAKAEYNLNPSAVSRFIAINEKYSIDCNTDRLRPEFALMGSSKLSEMLALPDSDLEMITPDTTRSDIRELKDFNKKGAEDETVPAAVEDERTILFTSFLSDNPDIIQDLRETEVILGMPGGIERGAQLVNPSGTRTYRKGKFFMIMHENNINVKQFGRIPESITWQEFFERTEKFLEEWENEPEENNGTTDEGVGEEREGISKAGERMREDIRDSRNIANKEVDGREGNSTESSVTSEKGQRQETPDLGNTGTESGTNEPERPVERAGSDGSEQTVPPTPGTGMEPVRGRTAEESPSDEAADGDHHQNNDREELDGAGTGVADIAEPAEAEEPEGTEKKAEEGPQEPEETSSEPLMTRKKYINQLTEKEAAEYIVHEFKVHRLNTTDFLLPKGLERWLTAPVRSSGEPFEM